MTAGVIPARKLGVSSYLAAASSSWLCGEEEIERCILSESERSDIECVQAVFSADAYVIISDCMVVTVGRPLA